MLEKAPVFDGDDGVHKVFGNLVKGDDLALGAVFAAEQGGDHPRFEFVRRGALAGPAGNGDRLDLPAFEADGRRLLGMEGFLTGNYFEARSAEAEMSNGRVGFGALLAVAGATQIGDEFLRGGFLADFNQLRPGIDFGGVVEDLARHSLVNDAFVLDVEEGKDGQE